MPKNWKKYSHKTKNQESNQEGENQENLPSNPDAQFYKVPWDLVVETYLKEYQGQPSNRGKAIGVTARTLNVPTAYVGKIVARYHIREEAAVIREKIVAELFDNKMPIIKKIVGRTLSLIEEYVDSLDMENIKSISDAIQLAALVTQFNNLIRLELGKSTANIGVIQKTHKDITIILKELKKTDPFIDYPEVKQAVEDQLIEAEEIGKDERF